jgi:hypothetical protein
VQRDMKRKVARTKAIRFNTENAVLDLDMSHRLSPKALVLTPPHAIRGHRAE